MKTLMLLVVSFPALLQANPANHFAVSDDAVHLASCSFAVPSIASMEAALLETWMQAGIGNTLRDEVIMGVSLKQQNTAQLRIFRKLVTPIQGIVPSSPLSRHQEDIQQSLLRTSDGEALPFRKSKRSYQLGGRVSKGCSDVLCALKSIFGEEQAIKILWLNAVYDVNASHLAGHEVLGTEYVEAWTSEDLDILIRAYAKLPAGIYNPDTTKTVSIMKAGLRVPMNRNTYATASMLFGSQWKNSLSSETKETVVFHELAHNIAFAQGLQNGNYRHTEWLNITGWSEAQPREVISNYSLKGADEDLAESIVAYRYIPQVLKQASVVRYDFIKKYIFSDKEFVSTKDCESWSWYK